MSNVPNPTFSGLSALIFWPQLTLTIVHFSMMEAVRDPDFPWTLFGQTKFMYSPPLLTLCQCVITNLLYVNINFLLFPWT